VLTGFAFLDRLTAEYIAEQVQKHELVELEDIRCDSCYAAYRLFAKSSQPSGDEDGQSDVKDLTQRAQSFIYRDCPLNVPKGQPRKPGHLSQYEFLDDGGTAV
jgi:hypothetical protein